MLKFFLNVAFVHTLIHIITFPYFAVFSYTWLQENCTKYEWSLTLSNIVVLAYSCVFKAIGLDLFYVILSAFCDP